MTDTVTGDATRPQPERVDLTGIDPKHPAQETPEHLLGTTVAETAAAVTGVHHFGGIAARTLDRARRQVLGTSSAPGVTVATENGATVIDLDIVVEYPHAIDEVVAATRTQVTRAARQLATGPVTVNITVTNIHGPFDQDPAVLDAIDQAADKARDLKDQAGEKVDDLKDQAAAKGAELKEQAGQLADQVAGTAADVADAASDAKNAADAKVADVAFDPKGAADQDAGTALDRLDAEADRKLDELEEKAAEKLDELEEAADDAEARLAATQRPDGETPR